MSKSVIKPSNSESEKKYAELYKELSLLNTNVRKYQKKQAMWVGIWILIIIVAGALDAFGISTSWVIGGWVIGSVIIANKFLKYLKKEKSLRFQTKRQLLFLIYRISRFVDQALEDVDNRKDRMKKAQSTVDDLSNTLSPRLAEKGTYTSRGYIYDAQINDLQKTIFSIAKTDLASSISDLAEDSLLREKTAHLRNLAFLISEDEIENALGYAKSHFSLASETKGSSFDWQSFSLRFSVQYTMAVMVSLILLILVFFVLGIAGYTFEKSLNMWGVVGGVAAFFGLTEIMRRLIQKIVTYYFQSEESD